MTIRRRLLTVWVGLFCCMGISAAEMVVVVSKKSELQQLKQGDVANIFLSRTNRFPNGDKAVPIELKDNQIRTLFYQRIADKSPTELSAYWTTLVFSGKGTPPRSYADITELIAAMDQYPSTISYMDKKFVTDDLKVIYHFPL